MPNLGSILAVGVALLVLPFSGCTTPKSSPSTSSAGMTENSTGSDPSSGPTTSPTPSPTPDQVPSVEIADCVHAPFAFEFPATTVQPHLPPDFTATSIAGDAFAGVNLNVYQCDAVVLGNSTGLRDVTIAETVVFVDTREEWTNGSTSWIYSFELFADDAAVSAYFTQQGVETTLADVAFSYAQNGVSLRLSVNGNEWYAITGSQADKPDPSDDSFGQRRFRAHDSNLNWFQMNQTSILYSFLDGVALTASHGILAEFTEGSEGTIGGLAQRQGASGIISFGSFKR